jgi:hypothetical protein
MSAHVMLCCYSGSLTRSTMMGSSQHSGLASWHLAPDVNSISRRKNTKHLPKTKSELHVRGGLNLEIRVLFLLLNREGNSAGTNWHSDFQKLISA